MAIWTAQVAFESATTLPKDRMVNTFSFEGSESVTDVSNIDDMLVDFYTNEQISNSISDFFPSQTYSGDYTVSVYCLDDPEPRVPRGVFPHSFTPSVLTAFPTEVSLVLSFHGDFVSGVNLQRQRGRIYLPALAASLNVSPGRPATTFINDVLSAAGELADAAAASTAFDWVVWSRAGNTTYGPVNQGWVDDEWDTQRRRGRSAANRYPWNI